MDYTEFCAFTGEPAPPAKRSTVVSTAEETSPSIVVEGSSKRATSIVPTKPHKKSGSIKLIRYAGPTYSGLPNSFNLGFIPNGFDRGILGISFVSEDSSSYTGRSFCIQSLFHLWFAGEGIAMLTGSTSDQTFYCTISHHRKDMTLGILLEIFRLVFQKEFELELDLPSFTNDFFIEELVSGHSVVYVSSAKPSSADTVYKTNLRTLSDEEVFLPLGGCAILGPTRAGKSFLINSLAIEGVFVNNLFFKEPDRSPIRFAQPQTYTALLHQLACFAAVGSDRVCFIDAMRQPLFGALSGNLGSSGVNLSVISQISDLSIVLSCFNVTVVTVINPSVAKLVDELKATILSGELSMFVLEPRINFIEYYAKSGPNARPFGDPVRVKRNASTGSSVSGTSGTTTKEITSFSSVSPFDELLFAPEPSIILGG